MEMNLPTVRVREKQPWDSSLPLTFFPPHVHRLVIEQALPLCVFRAGTMTTAYTWSKQEAWLIAF